MYLGAKVLLNIETNKNLISKHVKHFKLQCLEFFIENSKQICLRFNFVDTLMKDCEVLVPSCDKHTVSLMFPKLTILMILEVHSYTVFT